MKNLLNLIIDAAKNDDMHRVIELAEKQQDNFCDNNCVWTDHHQDCMRAAPVGFVVDRYNGANTSSLPPTEMVAWINDNPKIGQVLYAQPSVPTAQLKEPEQKPVATVAEVHMSRYTIEWTNGPLPEGSKLYITPPQREPLRYQQIRDLWARDNGLEDCNLCKLDDFIAAVRFVEAAHGIKGD